MPIYEYDCPKCRAIFSFLSKRINPKRQPNCPKCGRPELIKEISSFAAISGDKAQANADAADVEERKIMRARGELERDASCFDENNPRHIADLMRKMQRILPDDALSAEMETVAKRLESGEKPERIEEDMQELFSQPQHPCTEDFPETKEKEAVKKDAGREERAKQKNRSQLVKDEYKYDRIESELRLAKQQAVLEAFRPLWVHLGVLPEDEVNKKDETLNNGALLQMGAEARANAKRRQQAIWDGRSQELKTWQAEEEKIEARFDTMTNEEIERWNDMEMFVSMRPIALDDAKFASWRASVNEGSSPPAQNPGGLLSDDTTPAPVTNTDDGETSPAPSPGSEEETTSVNLGDNATPGSDSPTVPRL